MDYSSAQSTAVPGILWSCVLRNEVILAESYDNQFQVDATVQETAQKILTKKATPGWEFHTLTHHGIPKLKALKFHIYEHCENEHIEGLTDFRIWTIAAVYNHKAVEQIQVKSFVEKVVGITELFREHDQAWICGPQYAAQETFSPILLQRMQEVSYLGKMAMVQEEVDSLKQIMGRNINMIIERGEKVENLQGESKKLAEMAAVFKKNSKKLKKQMLWQNAKYGMVVGTAVTVGVAIVVTPIVL